jgi:hypothetical protein
MNKSKLKSDKFITFNYNIIKIFIIGLVHTKILIYIKIYNCSLYSLDMLFIWLKAKYLSDELDKD